MEGMDIAVPSEVEAEDHLQDPACQALETMGLMAVLVLMGAQSRKEREDSMEPAPQASLVML